MAVKKSAFASKSERRNYHKLRRAWGDKYSIYHNLPFLNVFTTKDLYDMSDWLHPKPMTLSNKELARLKKTSIDFTLCDEDDTPILCIEFDGMQEGFNVGAAYISTDHAFYPDPWRQAIMELKLKVAHGSLFPFFVVGSKQFADLSPSIKLTIVDGIIGEVLSSRAKHAKFAEGFDPEEVGWTPQDFESLPEWEQSDLVQDWALGVEVMAEMENNPLVTLRWEAMESVAGAHSGSGYEYVYRPSIVSSKTTKERIKMIESALLVGCRATLYNTEFGDVQATVWLPNFKIISHFTLLEEVAYILAIDRLKRMLSEKT